MFWVGKPEIRIPVGKTGHTLKINIKIYHKEMQLVWAEFSGHG
jgi:hypothetical protein